MKLLDYLFVYISILSDGFCVLFTRFYCYFNFLLDSPFHCAISHSIVIFSIKIAVISSKTDLPDDMDEIVGLFPRQHRLSTLCTQNLYSFDLNYALILIVSCLEGDWYIFVLSVQITL